MIYGLISLVCRWLRRLDHFIRYQFVSISIAVGAGCGFFNIKIQVGIDTNLGMVGPNSQFPKNAQKWSMASYHNFVPPLGV